MASVIEQDTVIAGDAPAAIDGEEAVDEHTDQTEESQAEEYHAIAAE